MMADEHVGEKALKGATHCNAIGLTVESSVEEKLDVGHALRE